VVDRAGFSVSGLGYAIPQNRIYVRALDAGGRVIAEETATMSGPPGGQGRWGVRLTVNVPSGVPGSIAAYAVNPATGRVVAEDRIRVTYGVAPAPVPPALDILQPSQGATVDASTQFVVNGRTQGIAGGYVLVHILNANGNLLFQSAAPIAQDGSWAAALRLLIANGTPGTIYAFVPAPTTGRPFAEDRVSVRFASNCTPRTDWYAYIVQPGDTLFALAQYSGTTVEELVAGNCITNPNLLVTGQTLYLPSRPVPGTPPGPPTVAIESPPAGASVPVTEPLVLLGSSEWTQPGNVWVRALDNAGVVLDEARVLPIAPAVQGAWTWEAELDLGDALTGTRGLLFAYAPSPVDGSIATFTSIPVIYGPDEGAPYITILSPSPYMSVAPDQQVTVSGQARGLTEGNLVVQAIDINGQLLALLPATVQSAEAGGEGAWEVTLPVLWVGRGRLVAQATDPATGNLVASAAIDVIFGDPRSQPNYVLITHPLPNTLLRSGRELGAVVGYAGGIAGDLIYLVGQDAADHLRFVLPVAVDPVSGLWSIVLPTDFALREDGEFTLRAVANQPAGGEILAADQISVRVQRPVVSGEITYQEPITLPTGSLVTVRLITPPASATSQPEVVSQATFIAPSQAPISFAVGYDPVQIDPNGAYLLEALITDPSGAPLFVTTQPYPVITQGNPTENVQVVVEPAP
jgi:uncharacterized lipoprotein YbaY